MGDVAATILTGNIFTSSCQTLVNTVNCVGVMGAGIALECRLRYPAMYERYVEICRSGKLNIGQLWVYRSEDRWILNFPTKKHWKYPSKEEFLKAGLRNFVDSYEARGIESIAFPLLGADRGGIDRSVSESILREYLDGLPIPVEIYRYDSGAADDAYDAFKTWLLSTELDQACAAAGIAKPQLTALIEGVSNPNIRQLNQLLSCKGVGVTTMEKVFRVAMRGLGKVENQPGVTGSLFDE